MNFLISVTDGQKQTTKKFKYSLLKALFNFIKDSVDLSLINPCDSPILRKTFKVAKGQPWTILDRDVVDEIVFIPKKIADRLREYIFSENMEDDNRVFPLGYTRAREIVKKAGKIINVNLKPHDLRRHAATYASRSGVPVEIVSKIMSKTC